MNNPLHPRVFCLGLNKTGTTSFHSAMTILGYKSLHWGGQVTRDLVADALEKNLPLLTYLEPQCRAFSDIEILAKNFELLDTQYPDSRYVLTVRPIESWLESREKHVKKNMRTKKEGKYNGSFLKIDKDQWRHHYVTHHRKVREYFSGRNDFIEIDIISGDGWEPICTLLKLPLPEISFPHANRAKTFQSNI